MATLTTKRNVVEIHNEIFIQIGIQVNKIAYDRFYDRATDVSANQFTKDTRQKDIKESVNNIKIDNRAMKRQPYNMIALSAIVALTLNNKLSRKDKLVFQPIKNIMAKYRNPVELARKIDKFSKAVQSNNFKSILPKDKELFNGFKKYTKVNKVPLNRNIRINDLRIKQVNKKMKLTTSRKVYRTLVNETSKRKIVEVDGVKVKVPLSQKEIRINVKSRLHDQVDWQTERVLKTELHALEENSKIIQHEALGYTHKRIITEHNARKDHKVQNRKIYKIDEEFSYGKEKGQFPGDDSFGTQRINCRCTVEFLRL